MARLHSFLRRFHPQCPPVLLLGGVPAIVASPQPRWPGSVDASRKRSRERSQGGSLRLSHQSPHRPALQAGAAGSSPSSGSLVEVLP